MPGYEAREAQLAMADAVEKALSGDRKLVCEAGTGTGKTLAYLVPAILSGKKVVISTATKALQEQIMTKDLPLLREHLGLAPDVALVKGLGNYLCLRRYDELRKSPEAGRPRVGAALDTVARWVSETDSGDLAELVMLPESDPIRADIASSSETRIGARCPNFERCFVTRMKRDAERARILIVNHHLFFADLAVRGAYDGGILPSYDAVIFDEAHQIEDVATDFFGLKVSSLRVETLLRDAERTLFAAGLLGVLSARGGERGGVLAGARHSAEQFFATMAERVPGEGRQELDPAGWRDLETAAYHRLDAALEALEGLASDRGTTETVEAIGRRAKEARHDLAKIAEGPARRVTWVEANARATAVGASPIAIGAVLKTRLFETVPAVVLTSATLATGSGFGFLRGRLGLDDDAGPVDELIAKSPFDYEANALLYLPTDLPEVVEAGFARAAAERVAVLVEASCGGAFVLCTSNRNMRSIHAELRGRGVRPLLLQGDMPKSALLARFRGSGNSVLVATMGFWEGVDVPGHALRLVVIDRAPFPVPADPLVRARSLAIEEAGESAFSTYHLPAAALALKQGFGRLIRTTTDRGVVAIFDRRVVKKSYGKSLLKALPPAKQTDSLEEVVMFLKQLKA